MAIARITLKCICCGKDFDVRKECRNRTDANNFETWAASHIDTCRDCKAAHDRQICAERLTSILASFGVVLPDITGVSDKQIKFAVDVRAKYLADNTEKVEKCLTQISKLADRADEFRAYCVDRGLNVDDEIDKGFAHMGLSTVRTMLTSTSARDILDAGR